MRLALRTSRRARNARIATIALIAVLGSAIGSGVVYAILPTAPAPSALPTYHLKKAHFGIAPGSGFFLDEANLRSGLDDFKRLGVHWIRSSIPWQNFQPDDPATVAPGASKYNWRGIDNFLKTINLPEYKGFFKPIFTVDGPPAWAKVGSRIGRIACAVQPPFDLPSYARAIAALAAHVKSTVHVFELENSPNIGLRSPKHDNPDGVWPTPNPCGYAALTRLTTAAVHKLNIGATVLVGGIGGVRTVDGERMAADLFLLYLYAYKAAFDGVSYHAYSTPNLPCAPKDAICKFDPEPSHKDLYGMTNGWDRMLDARRIMVASGDKAKKIWITEFGGPSDGTNSTGKMLTEQEQQVLLTAGFQRASQYSWVAGLCWFTYRDDGGNFLLDPGRGWMGLRRQDGSHKPSYVEYQRLAAAAS